MCFFPSKDYLQYYPISRPCVATLFWNLGHTEPKARLNGCLSSVQYRLWFVLDFKMPHILLNFRSNNFLFYVHPKLFTLFWEERIAAKCISAVLCLCPFSMASLRTGRETHGDCLKKSTFCKSVLSQNIILLWIQALYKLSPTFRPQIQVCLSFGSCLITEYSWSYLKQWQVFPLSLV